MQVEREQSLKADNLARSYVWHPLPLGNRFKPFKFARKEGEEKKEESRRELFGLVYIMPESAALLVP